MVQACCVWRKLQRTWRKVALAAVFVNILVLVTHYLLFTHTPPTRPRVIGFHCYKFQSCGGWADRQKGIVNAYVMATILGLEFRLFMPVPCDVSFFLTPREVDWRLQPGELEGGSVTFLSLPMDGIDFAKRFAASYDPVDLLPATEYVFVSSNMELVQYLRQHSLASRHAWLVDGSVAEVYREVLTRLFSPMPGPQLVLDVFRDSRSPDTKLVCAQIRMGGSWDTEYFNTMDQFQSLARFLAPYNNSETHRIMFTSDTTAMLEMARSQFPTVSVSIRGPVHHVDRWAGGDACGALGHTITEQLALTTCDVLIISESGLGKIAAFLRNSDVDLYLYHDGKVERFQRNWSFPNRVAWVPRPVTFNPLTAGPPEPHNCKRHRTSIPLQSRERVSAYVSC